MFITITSSFAKISYYFKHICNYYDFFLNFKKSYECNFSVFNHEKLKLSIGYLLLHEKNIKFLKGVIQYRKQLKFDQMGIWNVY